MSLTDELYSELSTDAGGRVLFLVMDGLGGFRDTEHGSELSESHHPNMDSLAAEGITGLLDPVAPGITPGSGPGHLGLFGYDPFVYEIGRGALSAAGLGFDLRPGDVAARVNICTLAPDGTIADRRAGRLATTAAAEVCQAILDEVTRSPLDGVEVFLETEREHRVLLVLRGEGLDARLADTDPQRVGVAPTPPTARTAEAARTAEVVKAFLDRVTSALAGRDTANFVLLRGFDAQTALPSFVDRYKMRAQALAQYPMYVGIARLLGMEADALSPDLPSQLDSLRRRFESYDFTFFHYKKTDSAGEDGDVAAKCAAIEEVDEVVIPAVREIGPDVVVITGDHATPTQYAAHSWHPVPVLVWSAAAGIDQVDRFDEEACALGSIGRIRSAELFPIVLAAAGRLAKYGA